MKINAMLIVFCLLFSSSVFALSPAVIGGVRGGVALGMMADEEVGQKVGLRFGAEANTGKKPLILFFGGKFYLTNISGRYPLSFGLGLVVYSGGDGNAAFGPSVSLIFDRPFDISRLFFEAGIDVADSGKLQLQAGYRL